VNGVELGIRGVGSIAVLGLFACRSDRGAGLGAISLAFAQRVVSGIWRE